MHTQIKGLGFYGPELLRTLQEVFDSAWQEISSSSQSPSAEDLERSRRDLAEMIILAHKSGLGPEEIKASVLGNTHATEPHTGDS